jgi:NitT/TauT family transport system substrate-binding protein
MFIYTSQKIYVIIRLLLLIAFLLTSLSACNNFSKTNQPLTPVTIQLAWIHQSQFAGLYVADQKGYYTEEGLKVNFIQGGPGIDKISPVFDGTAQFGITSPDELILARTEGKPVRAVATIFRRSPVVFISLVEKGIIQPQNFTGKTIRAPSNILPTLRAMMSKFNITSDQYTTVDLPSDLAMFASGDVHVWGVFSNIFTVSVIQAGYKIKIIYPDDYGVHFAGDTIFTTDEFIKTNPDLVLRFLRASLKGWGYAVENPGEIPAIVQKYAPDADPVIELARMNTTIPLVNTGEDHVGWMKPETWTTTEETLRKYDVLTKPVDVTQVYTMQFLEEIYK